MTRDDKIYVIRLYQDMEYYSTSLEADRAYYAVRFLMMHEVFGGTIDETKMMMSP